MAEGFAVDLAALHATADGVRRTVDGVTAARLGPVGAAAGHDQLGQVLDDFRARWQHGIQNLTEDGRAIADRLAGAEAAYRAVDGVTARSVDGGVLRVPSGPDPAAG